MRRVGLVLPLGLEVEKHRGVSVVNRLDLDALSVVVRVLLVLVLRRQAPGPEPAADCLLESVVVRFVRGRVLLVGTEQFVAHVGHLGRRAVAAHKINGHAVVAVLVDQALHGQGDLVDLKLRLVLVLLFQRAFPLRASD